MLIVDVGEGQNERGAQQHDNLQTIAGRVNKRVYVEIVARDCTFAQRSPTTTPKSIPSYGKFGVLPTVIGLGKKEKLACSWVKSEISRVNLRSFPNDLD